MSKVEFNILGNSLSQQVLDLSHSYMRFISQKKSLTLLYTYGQ